jgi:DNA-binding NarL/FixJ family response regulator
MATTIAPGEPLDGVVRDGQAVGIVADEVGRRRLEMLLARESVAVAASASDVPALLDLGEPLDVVVLAGDARSVARGGAVPLLQTLRPSYAIVLVAPDDDSSLVRKALRAGVDGYVPEPAVEQTLAVTISAVLGGQLAIPRSIRYRAPWSAFSSRERQVLELVADGATNQEIALHLHLSESTVKSHLATSFRKLGVSSRAEAATAVLDSETGLNACAAFTPSASPLN